MMSRGEAWLQHLSTLLVGGTGLAYFLFRYILEPTDPFALTHPLQPHAQHAHVLVAPVLVFGAGVIWKRHVTERLRGPRKDRRYSGIGLMLTLAPMVASGYLLQIASAPGWRTAWLAIHLGTSAVWLLAYAVHQIARQASHVPTVGGLRIGAARRPTTPAHSSSLTAPSRPPA